MAAYKAKKTTSVTAFENDAAIIKKIGKDTGNPIAVVINEILNAAQNKQPATEPNAIILSDENKAELQQLADENKTDINAIIDKLKHGIYANSHLLVLKDEAAKKALTEALTKFIAETKNEKPSEDEFLFYLCNKYLTAETLKKEKA